MRKFVCRVSTKLHALLKVDQIELYFVRAVVQRQVCDQYMQQRGFAGSRLSCHKHMLTCAATELHKLQTSCACPADWEIDSVGRTETPDGIRFRRNAAERHFHSASILGLFPNRSHKADIISRLRRRECCEFNAGRMPGDSRRRRFWIKEILVANGRLLCRSERNGNSRLNLSFGDMKLSAAVTQIADVKRSRNRLIWRTRHNCMHAAARSTCQNAC